MSEKGCASIEESENPNELARGGNSFGLTKTPLQAELLASTVDSQLREIATSLHCDRLITLFYDAPEAIFRVEQHFGFVPLPEKFLCDVTISASIFPDWLLSPETFQPLVVPSSSLPEPLCTHLSGCVTLISLTLPGHPIGLFLGQLDSVAEPDSALWKETARQAASRVALLTELVQTTLAYESELKLRAKANELTACILDGASITSVGQSITSIVAQLLQEERTALYLSEEDGRTEPVHLRNLSSEYGKKTAELAPYSPIIARALEFGQPYHAHNVQNDLQMPLQKRELFVQEKIESLLIAPLQFAEKVYGSLVVYPEGDREFTSAELAVFQSFADISTFGVALSRQLEQQKQLATTEERNRLAREMHDTVAQALTGLAIQLETAQNYLASGNQIATGEMLKNARLSAKHALEETRRAVQGLNPLSLESSTPSLALEAEAKRFGEEQGIAALFLLNGEERPLPQETQTALIRIAQEALNNAAKHAKASRVRVGLQFLSEEVSLCVEDDGGGFDVDSCPAPGPEGGYGLFGMRERARLLGGEVKIESTPGWGTRVLAHLPDAINPPRAEAPLQSAASLLTRSATLPVQMTSSMTISIPSGETLTPILPSPAKTSLRVLIADDHQVTRQGVKFLLEATGEIVVIAEANDGLEALRAVQENCPDVALFDLNMPNLDGIETLRRLRVTHPQLPVVIFTSFPTDDTLRDALRAGAKGYLKKDAASSEIVAAIHAAFHGETILGQDATLRLAGITERGKEDTLPERALEVLQLLAQGARNKEIAARLFISERTVEYHLSTLFSRLEVSNRTEAVRVGLDKGLIKR